VIVVLLLPAEGWQTGTAEGCRLACPKLTNLLGPILAKTWWRTAWWL